MEVLVHNYLILLEDIRGKKIKNNSHEKKYLVHFFTNINLL